MTEGFVVESSAAEFADGLTHSDAFRKKVKNSFEQYQSTARTNPAVSLPRRRQRGAARVVWQHCWSIELTVCRTIMGRTSFGSLTRKISNLTATIHPFRP